MGMAGAVSSLHPLYIPVSYFIAEYIRLERMALSSKHKKVV
jgi:hypothetical protein